MKIKALLIINLLLVTLGLFAQPTISSFTPISGTAGTSVTITVTKFNTTPSNNIVIFGATADSVNAATITSLTVNVPLGATYAPISVLNTTTGLLAYDAVYFTPTFASNKGNITATDFGGSTSFTTGSSPNFVAIRDLDGDGKSDCLGYTFEVPMGSSVGNSFISHELTLGLRLNVLSFHKNKTMLNF